MTIDNIALAKECGVSLYEKTGDIKDINTLAFTPDQLSQFVQRIRSDALEEAAKRMEELHQAQAGSSVWHNYFAHGAAAIRALDRLGGDGEVTR